MNIKSIIFITVITVILLLPAKANASDIALGIYPPIIQIDTTGPSDVRSPFTITNHSDIPLDVQIFVRPFTASLNNNGEPQYLTQGQSIGNDPDIFKKMNVFDGQENTNEIILAPSQKKNLELQMHLPKDEPSGDYYFSISMLSKPIGNTQINGATVGGGVSTNVLLSIGPKDDTTGYIQEFSSPFFITHGPVPFTLLVTNTSKHFIYPQGTILVKNMYGQIMGKVDLRQDNILAGSSRYLQDNVQSSVASRKSLAVLRPIAIWNENFLFGPYSATLTLALSTQGPLYRRTIYFFALPLQILIGIIVAIILLAVVVIRVKRKLK